MQIDSKLLVPKNKPFKSAEQIMQTVDARKAQQAAFQNFKIASNLTGPVSDEYVRSEAKKFVNNIVDNAENAVKNQPKWQPAMPKELAEKIAPKKQGFFGKILDKVQDSKILNKAKNSKAFAFVKKHKVACAIGAAAVATGAIIAGVVAHNKKKAENTDKA